MWLCDIEVTLRSLCKAGSYLVDDPEDNRPDDQIRDNPQVLNIERSNTEEHPPQCHSFIMEWSTKTPAPSNEAILGQVQRIDHKIRTKWTDAHGSNIPREVTFTRCIRKAEPTADSMWSADLSRDMEPRHSPDLKRGREKFAASKQEKEKGAGKGKAANIQKRQRRQRLRSIRQNRYR